MIIRSDMCKNLEYISLLQSRAMLAEPSKMHRNQPLAVHPATILGTIVEKSLKFLAIT